MIRAKNIDQADGFIIVQKKDGICKDKLDVHLFEEKYSNKMDDRTLTHPLWPYRDEKTIFCPDCREEIFGCNYDPDTGICYQCSSYLNNEQIC